MQLAIVNKDVDAPSENLVTGESKVRKLFFDAAVNYRDWDCGFATVFTADYHVGKKVFLKDGKMEKLTLGSLGACKYALMYFDNATELAEQLAELKSTQAMSASTPRGMSSNGQIVVKDKVRTNPGCLSRGKDHFGMQRGQRGLLVWDYDPIGAALSRAELWSIACEVITGVEKASALYWCSSSSFIYNGDRELSGLRGQRLYLLVKDAGDVNRAMGVLQKRLWLNGHGKIFISKSGSMLKRTPADETFGEDARLDYAGGPVLCDGLEQHRPAPEVLCDGGWLDTAVALPDLSAAEEHRYEQMVAEAKRAAAPEAEAARERATVEHARNHADKAAKKGEDYTKAYDQAAASYRAALGGTLTGDFELELDDGEIVTVGEVLDDPTRYHLRLTKDPIERDYREGHIAGKLYLFGAVPNLYSFAHDGQTFRLARQPSKITLCSGRSALNAAEYLRRLADTGDVFEKGGVPVRVLDGVRLLAGTSDMGFELGTRFAAFKTNAKGEDVPADAPDNVIRMVISGAAHGSLPSLRSYVKHPFVTESEIVLTPGYHQETGTFAEFDPSDYGGIPATPSDDEIVQATKTLWGPFEKFAFEGTNDKAAAFAVPLGIVSRPGLDNAPGALADAPVIGSGKTLLVSCWGALASGESPAVCAYSYGESDVELKKRIVSGLVSGSDTFIYDNVVGSFNSPTLAGCLTSGTIKERILGVSADYCGPGPQHIYITSNNATLGVDLSVRFLRVRLNHRKANPATLRFDFHPVERVLRERVDMLRACIVIMRAFHVAGSPHHGNGGYRMPAWDRLVRSAVIWLGRKGYIAKAGIDDCSLPFDPAAGMLAATEDAGSGNESLGVWLKRLADFTGTSPASAADILATAKTDPALYEATIDVLNGRPLTLSALRAQLNYSIDQIVGGHRLAKFKKPDESYLYHVIRV